jgi:N-methylhydantoinase B
MNRAPLNPEKRAASMPGVIYLEVFRNRLTAIADEMGVMLQRSAYSTNIKTRQDFSCAIFDQSGRAIAQSFSQPVHLGSLPHFVPKVLEEYGIGNLQPDEVLICNDGHRGGVHLNDVLVLAPVFDNNKPAAFVATIAHHLDVGGSTPGSLGLATDVFQEGVRIPPVRIMRGGQINQDVFKLIANNIRSPRDTSGDLRAQLAAVGTGSRRVQELIAQRGASHFAESGESLLKYSKARVLSAVSKLPAGTYEAVDYMDDDGMTDEAIPIAVKIEIKSDQVVFDLTGCGPQRRCPINSTYAMTLSNCAYALRVLVEQDIPVNHAFYEVVKVIAPEGSIVNPTSPSAISGGWLTALRVCETALAAFGKAMPERLAAGSKGCLVNFSFGALLPRTGEYRVFYEAIGGGYGARASKDGLDGIQAHGQNTENSPIEELEASYPVRMDRYALIPDSGGDGCFRGGLGIRRDYLFDQEVILTVMADRVKFAPWGLCGGGSARAARYIVNPDGEARICHSKATLRMKAGDIFSVQTAGGGGYGPASARKKQAILDDVLDLKITPAHANEAYGDDWRTQAPDQNEAPGITAGL